ncbi:MAG: AvaI/BsoBI family type II restriction endonuclease [Pyrinomonadaceae bacterium]
MAQKINNRLGKLTVDDLLTSREETRTGFIAMALEKNLMASQYVEEAKALKVFASQAANPRELLTMKGVRLGLLAASGLSNKSLAWLRDEDKDKAILGLIETFLEPAGSNFADELVYRYLLTKGDALGGSARNLAGALGDRKFLRFLISVLSLAGIEYSWKERKTRKWIAGPAEETNVEQLMNAVHWHADGKDRLLLNNIKVPLINKNVDLVLLDAKPAEWQDTDRSLLIQNSRYVALGELKGGIDPAGADEHWKTADTALTRSRTHFQSQRLIPPTFFIGAAIERSMAVEIVGQLEKGILSRAANLTKDEQLVLVCEWLVHL